MLLMPVQGICLRNRENTRQCTPLCYHACIINPSLTTLEDHDVRSSSRSLSAAAIIMERSSMYTDYPKRRFFISDQSLGRTTFWIGLATVVLFAIGCAAILWTAITNSAV
jgi:hypothetical protein